MRTRAFAYAGFTVAALAACLVLSSERMSARQAPTVAIDADDIGGVVASSKGPEAGVWVIAETHDLPTRFIKIVVTDDRGRYVLPDLPVANYDIWVRGYGLVDSPKVKSGRGKQLNLTAVIAPDARAAAQYYPANYWYSLLKPPAKNEFPGTGPKGNGISEAFKTQGEYLAQIKTNGCTGCHQLGNKFTREVPSRLAGMPSTEAWATRVNVGQVGAAMSGGISRLGRARTLAMFADWSDRIAAGEVPPAPPRPAGLERNLVLTLWDFADPKTYLHDGVSSYKPDPTMNPNGLYIAAPEAGGDFLYVLDPVKNAASTLKVPVRDPDTPFASPQAIVAPSPVWGEEVTWTGKMNGHSSTWDRQGRLWTTSTIRALNNPAWCKQGSTQPSAKAFPIDTSYRQLNVYDFKTQKFTLIDLCYATHHIVFGEGDYKDTLFFTAIPVPAKGEVLGWFDTKKFDQTHDEKASQGWTPFILDTNGNGKRDAYVGPDDPVDPTKDKRIPTGFYSTVQSPVDGSVWGSYWSYPGGVVRVALGSNPPETALTEYYEVPMINPKNPAEGYQGYSPRGLDIDRNGVVWTNLAGSGHLASFDRRKCKGPLNGPTATGPHCPEGWTLYQAPGPHFKGVTDPGAADALYLAYVDQFNTGGLGPNVPIALGSGSDSLLTLPPNNGGKFVVLRVPYPMGFHTKGMDGRIDDPKAGWKGRGLWASHGTRAPWHIEGGKGAHPQAVHFQIRPDPLAK